MAVSKRKLSSLDDSDDPIPKRQISALGSGIESVSLHKMRKKKSNGASAKSGLTSCALDAEKDKCHFCQLAGFSTHEQYPITVTNDVDNATFPKNFRFIENCVLGNGVERAPEAFRTGCSCTFGKCSSACDCLQDLKLAYTLHGPRSGTLRKNLFDSRLPIFECHESCACIDCPNRVVDEGRKVPLEIFRTQNRGWGR